MNECFPAAPPNGSLANKASNHSALAGHLTPLRQIALASETPLFLVPSLPFVYHCQHLLKKT